MNVDEIYVVKGVKYICRSFVVGLCGIDGNE